MNSGIFVASLKTGCTSPGSSLAPQPAEGEQSEATVYAAELQGILLALIIILCRPIQHAIIFTDNQAALRALQIPGRQSGQYILETVLVALEKARQRKLIIRFRWIPSHRGIDGNEQADTAAAKEAQDGGRSAPGVTGGQKS
ncbi:ribonuclease H family protein [Aspergillus vadensis CBS 113365]|uniref:RNase H type-1 domain-containing protein n=1 Tax=Aspergillus vadensis (strain CBS 113365 / IMI 142717 / IBT 24658) TaxID=1448311 RepID=A0A319BVM2_ASPVC|nr:hypothetical protein BO88DRAFT_344815 [Aspergillus vadensis CBS 113365]PYH67178.1 hypothetical protein BO88DRAFT_344815 [Aspergillus vadensis CBS 113365]